MRQFILMGVVYALNDFKVKGSVMCGKSEKNQRNECLLLNAPVISLLTFPSILSHVMNAEMQTCLSL